VTFDSAKFQLVSINGNTEIEVGEDSGPIQVLNTIDHAVTTVPSAHRIVVSAQGKTILRSLTGKTDVKSLSLMNASTDQVYPGFEDLSAIVPLDRSKITGPLALTAITEPKKVGSVEFVMQGCEKVIVNGEPPYVFKWKQPLRGEWELQVRSFSRTNGLGIASTPKVVLFKVTKAKDYVDEEK